MKILSYQSFSLYANGGGQRILRRLYQGRETDVVSLAIEAGYYKHIKGAITEKIILTRFDADCKIPPRFCSLKSSLSSIGIV